MFLKAMSKQFRQDKCVSAPQKEEVHFDELSVLFLFIM